MAERIEPIEVTIRYEYIDDDLKKAVKDIQGFETSTKTTLGQAKKNFSGLKQSYSEIQKSITQSNPKIVASMQKVNRSIENVNVAMRNMEKASASVKRAKSNFESFKRQLTAEDQIVIKDKIYKDTGGEIVVDEARTRQYTSMQTAVQNAQKSLQNARDRYKQSIQEVTKAEQALITTQNSLNKSTQAAEQKTEKLNFDIKSLANNSEHAAAASNTITQKIKGLRQAIKGIRFTSLLALIGAVRRLGQTVLNFVEASSSWIENLNLLESVFKDTTDEALDFVNLAADNFGLDVNALAEYVATFKQMANAMGQASETGTQLSQVLTLIALDVSSLRNVDIATVVSDFTSALAGQVKPVRKYGFDITMYSIDELMEEIGFGSMSRTMSQADKQLARAILLIRQSQDAWGDLAKTINTFANQQRVLNDQFQTSLRLMGNLALGTFNVSDSLEEAWRTAGLATKAIWVLNGALMAFNEVLAAFVPNTESIGGPIATEAEAATDALEEMQGAASGTLAEFDKFNALDQGTSTATSDALTAALEAMLNTEYEQYMVQYSERLKEINMYAKDIAATILNVLVPGYREWYDTQSKIEGSDTSLSAYFESTGESMDAFVSKYKNAGKSLLGIAGLILAIASPFAFFVGVLVTAGVQNEEFRNTLIELGESISTLMSTAGETFVNLVTTMTPVLQIILKISNAFLGMLNAVDGASLAVYALIAGILIFKGLKLFTSIMQIVSALKQANITLASIQKVAMVGGIITMISLIYDLATNWDKLSDAGKALRIILLGIASAFVLHGILSKIMIVDNISLAQVFRNVGQAVALTSGKLDIVNGKLAATSFQASKAGMALSRLGSTKGFTGFVNIAGSIMGVVAAITALTSALGYFTSNIDKMSGTAKTVIPIVAAITAAVIGLAVALVAAATPGIGLAKAIAAGVTAAALTAAVTLAIGTAAASAKGAAAFAQGGFTSGGLFYAGERGPEWVGRQGNTSTIMNDTQMSDIMRRSVAEGVAIGNAGGYNNSRRESRQPIILQVNGKKFLEIVEDEGKKVGKTMARVR